MYATISSDHELYAELFDAFVEKQFMSFPNGISYTAQRSVVLDRDTPPVDLPGPLLAQKWTAWSGEPYSQLQYWTNYVQFANGAVLRVDFEVTRRNDRNDVDGVFHLNTAGAVLNSGNAVSLDELFNFCGVSCDA